MIDVRAANITSAGRTRRLLLGDAVLVGTAAALWNWPWLLPFVALPLGFGWLCVFQSFGRT